jgi:light-regulated signal transduction histidine kinase (bacteriophytochrome)
VKLALAWPRTSATTAGPKRRSKSIQQAAGSHGLLLQLTTNLVHSAIVHNLPEQGTVWVTTTVHRTTAMLTVENTGEKLTSQLVATLVEPFLRGTERVRADHVGVGLGLAIVNSITQAHENPHPHPPDRWRALRHGATARRAGAHWQMTVRGIAARPREE